MHYDSYNFIGMHLIWWVFWVLILLWIFLTPYGIPGQRNRRETPLDILKSRLAQGQITKLEYDNKKIILEKDFGK